MQSFRKRDGRDGHERCDDHDKGGQVEEQLVSILDVDKLLHQQLDKVGDGLEDPVRSHPVRSHAVLHEGADLAFGVDQEQPYDRIEQEENHADDGHFNDERPEWRKAVVEQFVDRLVK